MPKGKGLASLTAAYNRAVSRPDKAHRAASGTLDQSRMRFAYPTYLTDREVRSKFKRIR
jgi:hypothetical protein